MSMRICSAISCREQITCDQHSYDLYSVTLLKHQSVCRYVAPPESSSLCPLHKSCVLSGQATYTNCIVLRTVWRYQRVIRIRQSIQQTTQWPNGQKDKQRSIKHAYKTKDRVARTPLKTVGELRCSGRVRNSCFTSGTYRVNLATNPVISHDPTSNRIYHTLGELVDHCTTYAVYVVHVRRVWI